MKINRARQLLTLDISKMNLEQLQKHKVNVIDAWRHSKAQYGLEEAVENGFYKIIVANSAEGFTPSDIWLTHQLSQRLDEIEKALSELYKLKEG